MLTGRPQRCAGFDVSQRRGIAIVVVDEAGAFVSASVVPDPGAAAAFALLHNVTHSGIDAPRCALESPRQWQFHRKAWGHCADRKLRGRHCELVVATLKLANPQWTPLTADAPPWMQVGFALFRRLASLTQTFEVFPTASLRLLAQDSEVRLDLPLRALTKQTVADLVDAWLAALTVHAFLAGRGCEVGNGDGLGSIILPRPVVAHAIRDWPVLQGT